MLPETDMLNCHSLRVAVFLSAFLLLASLTLEFAARLLNFPAPIMALALFSGLTAVAIMVISLAVALLPHGSKRFAQCGK
jgi:hypothetical protein